MNKDEFLEMIEMLTSATVLNRLDWKQIDLEVFDAEINGCRIRLQSYFDFSVGEAFCSIRLYNKKNIEFASYSFSEVTDTKEYKLLHKLFNTIRDIFYKISESESAIMSGLKELLK